MCELGIMNRERRDCFCKNIEWLKERKHGSKFLAKDVGKLSQAIGRTHPMSSCNWEELLIQGKVVKITDEMCDVAERF